ncbi:MAG: UbiA-like polyprenyltransferase [Candidatus Latescibacteria bacterium]|jgi:4-hydroxybenzoate polyprenyltransferase|nr:UbiA-like polyprenyltransferase [Candidatus Latescibacterota bacterium]
MVFDRVITYGRMIKFGHSIFALPFAFSGAALAAFAHGIVPEQVLWIVVAMVGARSAAMGFNRLVDREMDAANPRTANRELPRGVISAGAVRALVAISSGALIFAAYMLNPLCLMLSPVALGIVFFYSYTKRFTWATQIFLGLALALAPVGAWIAVTGQLDGAILLLGGAVLMWVAGFDVIYACQDAKFDRQFGTYSIPQKFGVEAALWIARTFHLIAFVLMVGVGQAFALGAIYFSGVFAVGALLIYEHWLVRHRDLSKASMASLTMNGVVSVVYFVGTLGDLLV